jgi:hypothetical protein
LACWTSNVSIAQERYYLAIAHANPLAGREEIIIGEMHDQKIIAFNRQILSFAPDDEIGKTDEEAITAAARER